ncbi:MAG: PLP-dependent cysteine synthase family protein [archaeon]
MGLIDWGRNSSTLDSMFEAIGRTPLVRLGRLPNAYNVKADVLCKIEFTNPTGSLKDRIYQQMITKAIENDELKEGMEIIEASTGNAGISCAFVGKMLGFDVTVVMPVGMSEERKKLIRAFGAEIVTTPGGESDVDLCITELKRIMSTHPGKYWYPNQFTNPNNVNAHFNLTGPEIWEQSNGRVDCFVTSQGTGGTLTGVGRYLRCKNPRVLLYAVEPAEAALLSKREWGTHRIEGIGDGFVPHNLDLAQLTGIVTTTSDEAICVTRRLANEGILCGISSGSNVAAAIKVARKHSELANIVTMINDSGQRYFSTELFGEKKKLDIPERQHLLDQYTVEQLNLHQHRWEVITDEL